MSRNNFQLQCHDFDSDIFKWLRLKIERERERNKHLVLVVEILQFRQHK